MNDITTFIRRTRIIVVKNQLCLLLLSGVLFALSAIGFKVHDDMWKLPPAVVARQKADAEYDDRRYLIRQAIEMITTTKSEVNRLTAPIVVFAGVKAAERQFTQGTAEETYSYGENGEIMLWSDEESVVQQARASMSADAPRPGLSEINAARKEIIRERKQRIAREKLLKAERLRQSTF